MRLKFLTTICFFAIISTYIYAYSGATATFSNIWIEHNVMRGDRKCLAIHVSVIVKGMKGETVKLVAYVESPKGKGHRDTNGSYCTNKGTVCASKKGNCIYESSQWSDFVIHLPNNEVHPKSGKNEYYVRVLAWRGSDCIGQSSYTTFSMRGNNNSQNHNNDDLSDLANHLKIPGAEDNDNDSYYNCEVCKGSGIQTCLVCNGTGGSVQWRCMTSPPYSSYHVFVVCAACSGNKQVKCTFCYGKGKLKRPSNNSNGYNGRYPNNLYNNGNSNNSSLTCRICGGSGVCTSCGGRGGEWKDTGYYTGSGNKSWINCPSCRGNKQCFNCRGTGKQY